MDLNQSQLLTEALRKKWNPILSHKDLPGIKDKYRRDVTTILLENEEKFLKEATAANFSANLDGPVTSNVARWDPILISLVRRSMPNLLAYDICGVQPMSGPTGLIFALRSRYNNQTDTEALFNEANSNFSNQAGNAGGSQTGTDPTAYDGADTSTTTDDSSASYTIGHGMTTAQGEAKGVDNTANPIQQMAFSIEKTTVTAKTRALKAEYTMELQQDLKAVHGLDAETELANILSAEILAEINREVVRTIYTVAKLGAQRDTVKAGQFDLNTDSNGRWSVEKFKGLLFSIERDCNQVAKDTRRGKGNIVICSSDVASALSMAGVLDYAPAMQANLEVDDTGNTFAGTLNGRLKVYIDPYFSGATYSGAAAEFYCVGYKGQSPYDAGLFYCPYVPLQMVRAIGQDSFQPKIGFRTRYGLVSNPFVLNGGSPDGESLTARINQYYRLVRVMNLL